MTSAPLSTLQNHGHDHDVTAPVLKSMRALAPAGARVVVATSGGPDSQALLDILATHRHALGISLVACGVDHGLRPGAAAELQLAADLARRHGVLFACKRIQLAPGGNLMAAARRGRYRALRQLARTRGASLIATAHTATDQTETILFRLARGSGLDGAVGIHPQRRDIIRPLLEVTREALRKYVLHRNIPFADDPTNDAAQFARTQLRQHVLPVLRRLNANVETHMAAFAADAQADLRLLQRRCDAALARLRGPWNELSLPQLRRMNPAWQKRIVYRWAKRLGLPMERAHICAIVAGLQRETATWSLPAGTSVHIDRNCLWVAHGRPYDHPVPPRGHFQVRGTPYTLSVSSFPAATLPCPQDVRKDPRVGVAFDGDQLHVGLRVRSWQRGDRLQPLGLRGHTKVGDIFTDAKIPRAVRGRWPLLALGDEIVWVVGLKRGAVAPVTPQTRRVVTIDIEETGSKNT